VVKSNQILILSGIRPDSRLFHLRRVLVQNCQQYHPPLHPVWLVQLPPVPPVLPSRRLQLPRVGNSIGRTTLASRNPPGLSVPLLSHILMLPRRRRSETQGTIDNSHRNDHTTSNSSIIAKRGSVAPSESSVSYSLSTYENSRGDGSHSDHIRTYPGGIYKVGSYLLCYIQKYNADSY
jgi:hypothetical protein